MKNRNAEDTQHEFDDTIYLNRIRPINRHPSHPFCLPRLSFLDHHHGRPSAAVIVVGCSPLGLRQVVQ
jgi:hypothetical protein